jgi:hypothetical protein
MVQIAVIKNLLLHKGIAEYIGNSESKEFAMDANDSPGSGLTRNHADGVQRWKTLARRRYYPNPGFHYLK